MVWEEYSQYSVCMHVLCIRLKTKTVYIICNIVSHTAEEIASVVKEMANTEFMLENHLDAIASDRGHSKICHVCLTNRMKMKFTMRMMRTTLIPYM